jgi:diguanylate cyclase (GGDEF)-like protein
MLLIITSILSCILGLICGFLILNNNNKQSMLTRPQLGAIVNKSLKKNNKLILFLINLNDFHSIIETFGYKIGNNIIEHNKLKISNFAKANQAKFYYVGFDEYVIYFQHDFFDRSKIINIANKLLETISEPFNYDNHNIHVTSSIGIGIFPDHANNSDLLLRRVEVALMDAKKLGGNSFSFYCSSLTEQAVDLTVINTELLTALNNNELQLYLQPQIDIKTNSLAGAEVLVRWNHPTKGNISPEIFIAIAEHTGLILQVGEWVIKHACIQAKFLSQELDLENFKIAINLSNGQFLQGDVVEFIATTIHETGIKPQNIEIELTESMFMHDSEKNLLMLSVLLSMGVKLAIDDFGTGYSSFNRLRQINWHYIKIDKSFIKNLNLDRQNYAIVSAIITMAKNLNIKVIAEGVETAEELAVLRKLDCDIIQGYYASKPLSIVEFIDFAKKYKVK